VCVVTVCLNWMTKDQLTVRKCDVEI